MNEKALRGLGDEPVEPGDHRRATAVQINASRSVAAAGPGHRSVPCSLHEKEVCAGTAIDTLTSDGLAGDSA